MKGDWESMRVNLSGVLNRLVSSTESRLNPRTETYLAGLRPSRHPHRLGFPDSVMRSVHPTVSPSTLRDNATLLSLFTLSTHNSPLKPAPPPLILHQPQKSWFCVILGQNPQKVNGISVSGPPKIGERPYPRPFHPVEFPHFLPRNRRFSTQNSHTIRQQPIKIIYLTPVLNPHSPHIITYSHTPPHLYSKVTNIPPPQPSTGFSQFNQALRPPCGNISEPHLC